MDQALIDYTLHLADNALILGHRNSEWCGHGPVLEQDIAMTNISLDLIGQARNFYQYAAQISGNGATEDTLAYLRDVLAFRNLLITELPNGNWADTMARQFFFSNYQYYLYQQLQHSPNEQIAAIAAKSLKEVTYHLRWTSEWVIRLGDGTEESHNKMQTAIQECWGYTGELFLPAPYETTLQESGIAANLSTLKEQWMERTQQILQEATLTLPVQAWTHKGGKTGIHTEYLGYILAEMQFLQRAHPGAEW